MSKEDGWKQRNKRRYFLIRKEHFEGKLSDSERSELDTLQVEAERRTNISKSCFVDLPAVLPNAKDGNLGE